MDGWLPVPGAHLRSGHEMASRFTRFPGAVAESVRIAEECASLRLAKPRLPKLEVPSGQTPISWLRELARQGADERYPDCREVAEERLQRVGIEEKDFPGYFLIVHDMVAFAGEEDSLPGQGVGGQLSGLLRARHHRGGPHLVRLALRAVLVREPRRGTGYRRRL